MLTHYVFGLLSNGDDRRRDRTHSQRGRSPKRRDRSPSRHERSPPRRHRERPSSYDDKDRHARRRNRDLDNISGSPSYRDAPQRRETPPRSPKQPRRSQRAPSSDPSTPISPAVPRQVTRNDPWRNKHERREPESETEDEQR